MNNERGNILFLILLAVVLFAALSYAVTSATRGDGKNASGEKAELVASQIMQQAFNLENVITRLRVSGGCKDNEISFENPTVSGYTNANTPVDGHCKVFDPAGGGLSWITFPDGGSETASAAYQYLSIPVAGVGAWQENQSARCVVQSAQIRETCSDLAVVLVGVPDKICAIINAKTGIAAPYVESGAISAMGVTKFTGTYSQNSDDIWNPTSGVNGGIQNLGKTEGCYQQMPAAIWVYYKVLIAR